MLPTFLAQAQTDGGGGGGGGASLLVFLPLILLFYFFMIRPQRQRVRQHQETVRAVQIGDEIETIAGVFGTVQRMTDEFLWVEIAPGTTIKMTRVALRRRVTEDRPTDDAGSQG